MSEASDAAEAPRASKRISAFRTIGEVAEDLALPAHVLRFWESKFPQLKPMKRGGGRRYYRPEDIVLLRRIRQCLYQDGYTIRGVQKLLREGGRDPEPAVAEPPAGAAPLFPVDPPREAGEPTPQTPSRSPEERALPPGARALLEDIRRDLLEIRDLVDRLRNAATPQPPEP